MKPKILNHKGYQGSVEVSCEENVIHGKILFITDLVTYEAEKPKDLQKAFQEAVEDYLETCFLVGKQPEKPFKGSLNIRIGEELHKKAAMHAVLTGTSINDFIKKAVEEKISSSNVQRHYHEHIIKVEEESEFRVQLDNITLQDQDVNSWNIQVN